MPGFLTSKLELRSPTHPWAWAQHREASAQLEEKCAETLCQPGPGPGAAGQPFPQRRARGTPCATGLSLRDTARMLVPTVRTRVATRGWESLALGLRGASWLFCTVPQCFHSLARVAMAFMRALHPNLLVPLTLGPARPAHPGGGEGTRGGDGQHGLHLLCQGPGRGQSSFLSLGVPASPSSSENILLPPGLQQRVTTEWSRLTNESWGHPSNTEHTLSTLPA